MEVYDKIKSLSAKSRKHTYNYLLLSLYVLFPPRRVVDYSKMIIVDKIGDCLGKDLNYVVLEDQKFVFNNYKTRKAFNKKAKNDVHSEQIFDVPKELIDVILNVVNKFGRADKSLLGMSENVIQSRLNGIFLKHSGKRISVTLLRHAYISYVFDNDLAKSGQEKMILANKMAHSVNVQNNYRKC